MYFALYLLGGVRKSILNVVAFVASTGCIVRTYSRGAIALIPITFFVTFALSFVGSAKGACMRLLMRIIPLGLVGLLGLGVMLPRKIERFEKAPEASANTRVELALCAKEMIIDEPWWGVGMNNWGIKIKAPYEYAARARRDIDFANEQEDGIVETVYLLVCAECGIPALVAMLAWFFRYLVLCVVLAKKLSGTYYAAIPVGLAGGLVACYLQSCLEWVLRQQMNLIILMVFFALLDHLAANAARLKGESAEKGTASV